MRSISRFLISSALLLILGACASTPPPEEVCSAGWIKPRTDAALADFKAATADSWESLQRSGDGASTSAEIGLLEKARVILSLASLVSSFQSSQALEDLRTLSRTCNDPELVTNALRSTLAEYGVPNAYIELLDELEGFIELMNNNATNG